MLESCSPGSEFNVTTGVYYASYNSAPFIVDDVETNVVYVLYSGGGEFEQGDSMDFAEGLSKLVIDNEPDSTNPIVPAPIGRNQNYEFAVGSVASWQIPSRTLMQQSAVTAWNLRWVPTDPAQYFQYQMSTEYGRFLPEACPDDFFASVGWMLEEPWTVMDVQLFVSWAGSVGIPTDASEDDIFDSCFAFTDDALLCEEVLIYYDLEAFWNAAITPSPYLDAVMLGDNINEMFHNCQETACYTYQASEDYPPMAAGIVCSLTVENMTTVNMSCPSTEPYPGWCADWALRGNPDCFFETCTLVNFAPANVNASYDLWFTDTVEELNGMYFNGLGVFFETGLPALDYPQAFSKLMVDNAPISYDPLNPPPEGRDQLYTFTWGVDVGSWVTSGTSLTQQMAVLLYNRNVFPPSGITTEWYKTWDEGVLSPNRCPDDFYQTLPWIFVQTVGFRWSLDTIRSYVEFISGLYVPPGTTDASLIQDICETYVAEMSCLTTVGTYYTAESYWNTSVLPNPYRDATLLAKNINEMFYNCQASECVSVDLS
jgi:hypothetical protein